MATGSAELFGADADETGQCRIAIDGNSSASYEGEPDDIGTNNQMTIAVTSRAHWRLAPTPSASTARAAVGTVGKDDAAIAVWTAGT